MARAGILVVFVLIAVTSVMRPAERARAALDLPLAGGLAIAGDVTVDGELPPHADPSLDLHYFCWLQVFSSIPPGTIAYFEADANGNIEARCESTEYSIGTTFTYHGSATGTIDPVTRAFHVEMNWQTESTSQFFNILYTMTGDIDGTLGENGYADVGMTFEFERFGTNNDFAYGGTAQANLGLHPNLPADLFIDHIEVVQVVQDAENTVSLVAGKNSVARVFVRGSRSVQDVTVTLKAERAGVEIGGIPALLPGSSNAAQANMDREKKELSYNYLLPASWVSGGSITLIAEVTGPVGLFDGNTENNQVELSALFQERKKLTIDYLSICLVSGQSRVCPGTQIANYPTVLNSLYPLPENGVIYRRSATPSMDWSALSNGADVDRLVAQLRRRYDLQFLFNVTDAPDQLAGWSVPTTSGILGNSDPLWANGRGRATYNVMKPSDVLDSFITLSHEVGHNLGLRHSNTTDGCNAIDPNSDWPFSSATIQEVGWAFATNAVVPKTKFDMMSYCSPPATNMWIAPFSYNKLFQANSVPSNLTANLTATTYLVLSGSAASDGSSGTLGSPITVTSSAAVSPSSPGGNHCIRFDTSAANDYCFDFDFVDAESQTAMDEQWFSLVVPLPANTTRISLRHGTTELAAIEKSPHAPTVQITAPTAGQSWSGQQTLAWVGHDDDGDGLTYTVLHSADGGATWIPILLDDPHESFTFDVNTLENGANGVFKVLVSDGLNTGEASVGQLTFGTTRPWGDLRCTGALEVGDALALRRAIAGLPDEGATAGCGAVGTFVTVAGIPDVLRWGDLQCDGQADAADVLLLLRELAGIGSPPPSGCQALGATSYVTF